MPRALNLHKERLDHIDHVTSASVWQRQAQTSDLQPWALVSYYIHHLKFSMESALSLLLPVAVAASSRPKNRDGPARRGWYSDEFPKRHEWLLFQAEVPIIYFGLTARPEVRRIS